MARLRGRAPRGERLRAGVPHGHWRTTTFVSGLRLSGIDAPMLIDGAINGESFLAYVQQVLVPTLRPGDVVVPPRAAARVPFRDRIERLLTLDGQSRQPQERHRARGHRTGWGRASLPPGLQPRLQPIRRRAPDPIPQGPPPKAAEAKTPSPSSRRCSGRLPPEPVKRSGRLSPKPSRPSQGPNVPTTSPPQATNPRGENLL